MDNLSNCILEGDSFTVLRTLPDNCVQCCITSPPYYALRDYGVAGQIGLEKTPAAYVEKLVQVFREVRRVLRADGVLWLNLGDSYANDRKWGGHSSGKHCEELHMMVRPQRFTGLPGKNLLMIPARVALALQDDGWILRSDVIWQKPSAMPECLDPATYVYVKNDSGIHRVTLDDVLDAGELYPLILTPTGWRPILKAWEVVKETAITFEAAKVSTVTCSPEHLWPVSHDRRRVITHDVPTAQLRDTGYNDYLLHYTIEPFLDGDLIYLDGQALDYDLGWLIGLFAAEGGFGEVRGHRCKFTMHANEREAIDRATSIIATRFNAAVTERTIANYTSFRFASKEWHELAPRIISGKCTTKSLNLDIILNAPREFRQGIWEGYLIGDGFQREQGVGAISASKALRDAMCVVASSVGLITSKKENNQHDERTGKTYTSYTLWTPYVKHRQQKANRPAKQITIRNKKETPGSHRMIDLEVDGGLFLIDDGLVTHNSVTDRPTTAHEHVFLFAKSEKYYYDAAAIQERSVSDHGSGNGFKRDTRISYLSPDGNACGNEQSWEMAPYRNRRTVWTLPAQPYPGAHFATMPPKLVELCLLAATSPQACGHCGTPWQRVMMATGHVNKREQAHVPSNCETKTDSTGWAPTRVCTDRWESGCTCPDNAGSGRCLVLDPFMGAGTVALVALQYSRRYLGVELNPAYIELANERIEAVQPRLWTDGSEGVA